LTYGARQVKRNVRVGHTREIKVQKYIKPYRQKHLLALMETAVPQLQVAREGFV